ncbi:class I adenylate-forming enzyme family protein [Streptomyces sp. NPDC002577]
MTVLSSSLRAAAHRFPGRMALVHESLALRYGQLDMLVDRLAAGLARQGVRAGDLVALSLPAGAEYVAAYLALARIGAVTTGVNPRLRPAERAAVLTAAAPQLVLATEELAEGVPSGCPVLRCVPAREASVVWHGLLEDTAPPPEPAEDLDRPETVVFTSGTTGAPKGALFASRQIAAITAMDTGGQWGTGGPLLVATGLPHVGFMTKLAGHLQAGATMHVLGHWRAADALRVIARKRVPYIGGVAAQISLLLHHPSFESYDFSHVRGLMVGGGPSPAATVREARARFDAGYSVRYSLTESGGLGTLTRFDAPEEETLHTAGRPRPGITLEIRDPDTGHRMGLGETGEIVLSGDTVMAGYWRDPQATARVLSPDRHLRTGDLGFLGEDGCLRVTGRIKDMYIRGGYNVFPHEVESVLLDHPGVQAVAVVPRPDPVMGEIGVAVVVPRPGVPAVTLDELRAFAALRLARYKLPEALRLAAELPLTSMDKVDRRLLAHLEQRAWA